MSENEKLYSTTMAFARMLLRREILTEDEYHQLDAMLTEKYAISSPSLFSDIGLITYQNRGNI